MKRQRKETSNTDNPIININAGGTIIQTRLDILTKNYPDSTLANMFKNVYLSDNDDKEPIFIDTDSKIFSYIIQYIRRNMDFSIVPENVDTNIWYAEVDYWNLPLRCHALNLHREMCDKKMKERYMFFESIIHDAGKDYLTKTIQKGFNVFTYFIPDIEDFILSWNNTPLNIYIKNICPFKLNYLGTYVYIDLEDPIVLKETVTYSYRNKKFDSTNTKTLRVIVWPWGDKEGDKEGYNVKVIK